MASGEMNGFPLKLESFVSTAAGVAGFFVPGRDEAAEVLKELCAACFVFFLKQFYSTSTNITFPSGF